MNLRAHLKNIFTISKYSIGILTILLALLVNFVAVGAIDSHIEHYLLRNTKRLVDLAALRQEYMLEANKHLLVTASLSPLVRQQSADCSRFLTSLIEVDSNSYLKNIGVISNNGTVVCSAVPYEGTVDASDRPYFQKALNTKDFSVGEYQIGRITRSESINYAYPIILENGEVNGVIFTALGLDWFQDLIKEIQVPEDWEFKISDRSGNILAAHPNTDLGNKALDASVLSLALSSNNGSITHEDDEGKMMVYSYRPLLAEKGGEPSLYLIASSPIMAYSIYLKKLLLVTTTITSLLLVAGYGFAKKIGSS